MLHQKKYFVSKKVFRNGAPSLNQKPRELTSTADAGGFNNNKIIKCFSKETSKNIWGKLDIQLHIWNRKVIFTVFCAKEINKLVSYYQ